MRLLLLFLLSGLLTAKAQNFQVVSTLPHGGSITALDFLTPQQGFAIITYYCVKTNDGGQGWSTISQEQFGGAYTYTAMAVADSSHIYLGKNSGGRLRYTKNGSNWNDLQVGVNQGIRAIQFLDTLNGFMLLCGNSGSVDSVRFMKTTDGGDSWSGLSTLPEKGYDAKIRFVNTTTGFVFYQENLFYTTDGGQSWGTANGIEDDIHALDMLNGQTGLLAGRSGYVAHTTDGGSSWATIPTNTSNGISDIQVLNPAEAYAITYSGTTSYLRHSTDSGSTWTQLATGSNVRNMDFDESGGAWFYGLNNNVYTTGLPSSLPAFSAQAWQVFPNPFLNRITVESPEALDRLELLDLNGRIILNFGSSPAGRQEFRVAAELSTGVYLLRSQSKSGVQYRKLVKE